MISNLNSNNEKLKLTFWLRRAKITKSGHVPVVVRLTVSGFGASSVVEFSSGCSVLPARWCNIKKRCKDDKINMLLVAIEQKANSYFLDLLNKKAAINAEKIRDLILERNKLNYTVLEVFDKHNSLYTGKALTIYEIRKKHLKEFLETENMAYLLASDLNSGLMMRFNSYLLGLGLSQNYLVKILQAVKKVAHFAYKSGFIEKNMIEFDTWAKKPPKALVYLDAQELARLEALSVCGRLERVKDLFVFACFTGLSFIDLEKLNKSNLVLGVDGRMWLKIERQKSGSLASLPFLDKAETIWQKYGGRLPVLTNQKYNAYLKELSDLAKIDKDITTHTARKTFANLALNVWMVSFETLAKMLGHKDVKITQKYYARLSDNRVSNEMKNIL